MRADTLTLQNKHFKATSTVAFFERKNAMIKHIVCFKLKDNSKENVDKTAEILMSMKGKVDLIRDIEVGVDLSLIHI